MHADFSLLSAWRKMAVLEKCNEAKRRAVVAEIWRYWFMRVVGIHVRMGWGKVESGNGEKKDFKVCAKLAVKILAIYVNFEIK